LTGSLGAKVYRHLLSLPFRYFEVRKVGNIIARVRELENLRQFMTNISLTVLLDTVFSVLFIVIMALYQCLSDVDRPFVRGRHCPDFLTSRRP